MIKEFASWGAAITSSSSVNQNTWLWELLKRNVPPDHWRCAINTDKIIATSHIYLNKEKKFVFTKLFSSAFSASREQNSFITEEESISGNFEKISVEFLDNIPFLTQDTLEAMTIVKLKKICNDFNIRHGF